MKRIALAFVVATGAAGVVVATGALPLAASGGHWPVTRRILEFTMRRSIETWSMAIDAPPLDDPALVIRGAGAYEQGCRSCHGAPAAGPPPFARLMLPPPPDLWEEGVADWTDEALFYVVKHGVRFTGMPAWPATERDDEIWPLVAFLRELPSLDEEGYAALVGTEEDTADVPIIAQRCVGCHGADGLGRGAYPRLSGQRPEFLVGSLLAYAQDERPSGVMAAVVHRVGAEGAAEGARWFAELPSGPPWPLAPEVDLARGKAIATGKVAGIPACVACHGPGDGPFHPAYPTLAGQDPAWLVTQLALFREGTRGGTPYARIMDAVASHALDATDAPHVAAFYATLFSSARGTPE